MCLTVLCNWDISCKQIVKLFNNQFVK
jgi:hypothetical protein